MLKVFSSNELSETVLVRDALHHAGFAATIQNQHSGRSAIPGFRPPAEVWVTRDQDYDSAREIVVATIATLDTKPDVAPWMCSGCREENPGSFEICWSCGRAKSDS